MKKYWLPLSSLFFLMLLHIPFIFLPPYMKDELYYYLSLPHLWRIVGEVKPFFWFTPSHFPPLFLWVYYVISPNHYIAAHFIGFLSVIFFILFLFFYFKRFEPQLFPANFIIGTTFFLTIPVIFQISATAYVGIWVATFLLAYIYFLRIYIENDNPKFLFLASLMMALGVATKYTGLSISVIMGLLSIFLLKNRKQVLQFLTILPSTVIILNLPWLIMNYKDTGNPIYPLLGKFFTLKKVIHYNPAGITFSTYISPIMVRKFIYGENWFQILTAPLRVFFYGREGIPSLFDGALASFLLIFLPFAKLRKNILSYILISASILYITIAFLSTPLRARYLIPVIPLLLLPSAEGFLNLYQKKKLFALFLLGATLIYPLSYMIERYKNTEIIPYLTHKVSETQWKRRHIIYYDAYKWVNHSKCTKVFLYFNGRRGYYINKLFMFEPSTNVEGSWFYYAFKNNTLKPFTHYNVDCLFISKPFFSNFLKTNFKQNELQKLPAFFENHFELIYNDNLVEIWKLKK